jgi:hypothetical protein
MQIKTVQNGVVYEMEDNFEGVGPAVISITYSAGEFGELEFEYATVDAEQNPELTSEQIQTLDKILECGLEETVVSRLIDFYLSSDVLFSPNEYEYLIENTNS